MELGISLAQALRSVLGIIGYLKARLPICTGIATLQSKQAARCAHPSINQSPFSFLNRSQASFSVLKTALLIIVCSVVAVVGSYLSTLVSILATSLYTSQRRCRKAYLVRVNLGNPLHVSDLDLSGHDQLAHPDLPPTSAFP